MVKNFKKSLAEFQNMKNLCIMALLIALFMVVRMLGTIKINSYLQIRLDFLIYIISGSMFGPVFSIFFGFITDVLGFYVTGDGTSFHFGFTFCSILSSSMYGFVLYKYKLGFFRMLTLQVIHDIIVCFLLNTYWLASMCFKNNFLLAFTSRFPKECLMLPIRCVLAVFVGCVFFKRVVVGLKLAEEDIRRN